MRKMYNASAPRARPARWCAAIAGVAHSRHSHRHEHRAVAYLCGIRLDRADPRLLAFAGGSVKAKRVQRAHDLLAYQHPIREWTALVWTAPLQGDHIPAPPAEHRE